MNIIFFKENIINKKIEMVNGNKWSMIAKL